MIDLSRVERFYTARVKDFGKDGARVGASKRDLGKEVLVLVFKDEGIRLMSDGYIQDVLGKTKDGFWKLGKRKSLKKHKI